MKSRFISLGCFVLLLGSGLAPAGDAPAGAGEPPRLPAGYALVRQSDAGLVFSTHKGDVATAHAALKQVFPDLAKYLDARPDITGAYEDSQSHRTAAASFTGKLKGRSIKGSVLCSVDDKGAGVVVMIANSDAPPAELARLGGPSGPTTAPAAAGHPVELKEYQFPDGTGSVGLAPGWTTQAQTLLGPVGIEGPNGQRLTLGFSLSVVTPDSQTVQIYRQLVANARALNSPPPPPPQVLVAPYVSPAQAINDLVPQLSQLSQRSGGPALQVRNVAEQQEVRPNLPGGKAAILSYDVRKITRGQPTDFKVLARVEITPIAPGSWMLYMMEGAAPPDRFAQDLPVMIAMSNSIKENAPLIAQRTRQNIDAANQRFAAMQQSNRELQSAYDRYNKSVERNSVINSRSNADFDEVIRGYRDVLDTRTGERTSVDLGNVDGIVNKLNEYDPGRYKQIPLRDELYPLPPSQ